MSAAQRQAVRRVSFDHAVERAEEKQGQAIDSLQRAVLQIATSEGSIELIDELANVARAVGEVMQATMTLQRILNAETDHEPAA